MIEVVQVLPHILNNVLNGDVNCVFNNALVEVPNDVLDHSELLEKLSPGVEDLVREDVLLAIDPEVGETFLRGVEYLG